MHVRHSFVNSAPDSANLPLLLESSLLALEHAANAKEFTKSRHSLQTEQEEAINDFR